jgi:hypothetical protein
MMPLPSLAELLRDLLLCWAVAGTAAVLLARQESLRRDRRR